ncbi:GGDEF domain-containing protein [Aliidiomarina sp. Khilg15.8]
MALSSWRVNPFKAGRREYFSRRLTTSLLIQISLWSFVLVCLATGAYFWQTYQQARSDKLETLVEESQALVARENALFERVESATTVLGERFLTYYQALAEEPRWQSYFDDWYPHAESGVQRLRSEFYQGELRDEQYYQYLSGFIGRFEGVRDGEFKARVTLAQRTLAELGPAWRGRVENTHISLPENSLLMYSERSAWGSLARADLDIREGAVVRSTLQAQNPQRLPNWTGLYFDESAGFWSITHQRPVDWQGRHLITPSQDIALSDIFARLLDGSDSETLRFILNQRSELVAADKALTEGLEQAGVLHVSMLGNPVFSEADRLLNQHAVDPEQRVIELAEDDRILIATPIEGPDWWHLTVFPQSFIRDHALQQSLQVGGLGVTLLLLVLLVVYVLVKSEVSAPLRELARTATLVGEKRYEEVARGEHMFPGARSEVGLLARSMQEMAVRILEHQRELEQKVTERTRQLAKANQALDKMAYLDGLTGIMNRRAFDRDLAATLNKDAASNWYLVLADVDEFKNFNDTQGHQAGDQALIAVAQTLDNHSRHHAYRYGGEEIAILLEASSADEAQQKVEKLREEVEALGISHPESSPQRVTVSLGGCRLKPELSAKEAIEIADKALYQAKHEGRNCTRLML